MSGGEGEFWCVGTSLFLIIENRDVSGMSKACKRPKNDVTGEHWLVVQ